MKLKFTADKIHLYHISSSGLTEDFNRCHGNMNNLKQHSNFEFCSLKQNPRLSFPYEFTHSHLKLHQKFHELLPRA